MWVKLRNVPEYFVFLQSLAISKWNKSQKKKKYLVAHSKFQLVFMYEENFLFNKLLDSNLVIRIDFWWQMVKGLKRNVKTKHSC